MVVRGVHEQSGAWKRFQTSGLRISLVKENTAANVQPEVAYEIDGDAGGVLPLEVIYSGSKAMIVSGRSVGA
jgi:hypothetical protein